MSVKKARSSSRPVDRIAAEFAEVQSRKIAVRNLVWMFRIITSHARQAEPVLDACVAFLRQELGPRCRAVLEMDQVDRKRTFHDFIVKSSKITPDVLRKLDRGLAECGRRAKVKYAFVGYGEDVYQQTSWKTLGTLLDSKDEPGGDLDCRELRFDGLYREGAGDDSCSHLRFYPDGDCLYVNAIGSIDEVARWLHRERKGLTRGTYKLKEARLTAKVEQKVERGEEPTIFKLKARLTKQGLKLRAWSSHSDAEYDEVFAFYQVKLK